MVSPEPGRDQLSEIWRWWALSATCRHEERWDRVWACAPRGKTRRPGRSVSARVRESPGTFDGKYHRQVFASTTFEGVSIETFILPGEVPCYLLSRVMQQSRCDISDFRRARRAA